MSSARSPKSAPSPTCAPAPNLEGHNRIGNFVETKKARLGRGTKASHLSYLGDAVIGRETNVGCGVITVNYDGYDKHQTHIGDRCMVGCDTQLIAPVTVGDDVYVASGTTIVRDVADGALVMSHHPQREKSGWTASWHQRHADHPKALARRHSKSRGDSGNGARSTSPLLTQVGILIVSGTRRR